MPKIDFILYGAWGGLNDEAAFLLLSNAGHPWG